MFLRIFTFGDQSTAASASSKHVCARVLCRGYPLRPCVRYLMSKSDLKIKSVCFRLILVLFSVHLKTHLQLASKTWAPWFHICHASTWTCTGALAQSTSDFNPDLEHRYVLYAFAAYCSADQLAKWDCYYCRNDTLSTKTVMYHYDNATDTNAVVSVNYLNQECTQMFYFLLSHARSIAAVLYLKRNLAFCDCFMCFALIHFVFSTQWLCTFAAPRVRRCRIGLTTWVWPKPINRLMAFPTHSCTRVSWVRFFSRSRFDCPVQFSHSTDFSAVPSLLRVSICLIFPHISSCFPTWEFFLPQVSTSATTRTRQRFCPPSLLCNISTLISLWL